MTILDDLQELLEAKSYGKYLAARCIFHNDSHASLMVYEDYYRCLACDKHGSTQSLLKQLGNNNTGLLSFSSDSDNNEYVPNPFTRWLRHKTLNQVLKSAWETLNQLPAMGRYITEERQINEQTRRKLGIGYIDDYYTFPIIERSRTIVGAFARSRSGKSRYFIPRGQDPNLIYAPRSKTSNGKLFLTFGGIDAISLTELGYSAISTTTGKRIKPEALDHIRTKIVIIPDYNEEQEAYELASKLGWRGSVNCPPYPEGTKDCNEWFVKDRQSMKEFFSGLEN
jgi:hypothetical protein